MTAPGERQQQRDSAQPAPEQAMVVATVVTGVATGTADMPTSLALARRQPATPADLVQRALELDHVDLDRLERLMALQRQWEAEQAACRYAEAMAACKAELPAKIVKNRVAERTSKDGKWGGSWTYATLGTITETVVPIMARHGLSHRWVTAQEGRLIRVSCIVRHVGGHEEVVTLESEHETSGAKNPLQALGSAVSYLQRYTLVAAMGFGTDDADDDGVASGPPVNGKRRPGRGKAARQEAQEPPASRFGADPDEPFEGFPPAEAPAPPEPAKKQHVTERSEAATAYVRDHVASAATEDDLDRRPTFAGPSAERGWVARCVDKRRCQLRCAEVSAATTADQIAAVLAREPALSEKWQSELEALAEGHASELAAEAEFHDQGKE